MADNVRDWPRISLPIRADMKQALADMSDETGEAQTAIVRRAVAEAVAEHERQKRLEEMSDD